MIPLLRTQTYLDRIVGQKLLRLQALRAKTPAAALRERVEEAIRDSRLPSLPAAGFAAGLRQPKSLGVIAEIKKASPSRGIIQPDYHPAEQALAYAAAGVQAISVLTEEDFFQGSDQDLRQVQAAVPLPLLRKDFIIEPGQVFEARLLGASAVLLICSLLSDRDLGQLLQLTHDLGLQALVEVHSLPELMRALSCGARIIGINNRDLNTFQIDLSLTERLAGLIPADRTIVAESGIVSARDLARIYRAGAHAVLIGEALMRAAGSPESVRQKLGQLFEEMPR